MYLLKRDALQTGNRVFVICCCSYVCDSRCLGFWLWT